MFDSIVMDRRSDVLCLYCVEWSEHCKEYKQKYNELAKYVHKFYATKNIKIVYLDGEKNDIEDMRVDQFPTLIFYAGNKKKGRLVSKEEQETLDDIVDFLDEHAVNLNKQEL